MTVGNFRRPLGLEPAVASGEKFYTNPYSNDGNEWLTAPRLTPFGHSLLELLRSEGVVSSNELIRTTSQEVVDALAQIEELEE